MVRYNRILDLLAAHEIRICNYFLRKQEPYSLDPIVKKRLSYPTSWYPGKTVPLEWWYFNGHVHAPHREFGFHFLLIKVNPIVMRMGFFPWSLLRRDPYYVCHWDIADKKCKKLFLFQRRGAFNPVVDETKLDLSMRDVSLKLNKEFAINTSNLSLKLKPLKKLVKHCDNGYGIAYGRPEHRTYYMSFSRMATKGSITLGNKKYHVTGESWCDHQKSNVVPNSPIMGWDWFNVLFDDGTELMFVIVRDTVGLSRKHRWGTFVHRNSSTTALGSEDVQVRTLSTWKSSRTNIVYPSGWTLKIPKLQLTLTILPVFKDQELNTRFTAFSTYWEGACEATGVRSGRKISGRSYVELVGYDNRFLSQLIRKSVV